MLAVVSFNALEDRERLRGVVVLFELIPTHRTRGTTFVRDCCGRRFRGVGYVNGGRLVGVECGGC